MSVATAWLLALAVSAADAEPRAPLLISVVHSPSNFLVNYAEVAIYAPNGQCVRRGQTGLFGEPFQAEAREPLDPAFKTLRVIVRKTFGMEVATASITLVYERDAWRLPVTENRLTGAGQSGASVQLTALASQRGENDRVVLPIEVPLRFSPLPVCRMPPWQAYVGGCGGVGCGANCPTCVRVVPFPAPATVLPPAIPPIRTQVSPDPQALAKRAATITDLGRAPAPNIPWAEYGSVWVDGPLGMHWQVRVLPPPSNPPATGRQP